MWIEIQTPEAPTPGWCANGIFHTDSLYVSAGSKDGEPFAKIGLNSPEVVTLDHHSTLFPRDFGCRITTIVSNDNQTVLFSFLFLVNYRFYSIINS